MDKNANNRIPAWKIVYDSLKAQIMTGAYDKDSYLTETSVAEQFHVSRTPVRDAILRLRAEGLLTSVHRKGLRVNYSREEDAIHLFYACRALEPTSARLAAINRTEDEINELISIHKKDFYYYHDDNGQTPPGLANYHFHVTIAKLSHNPYLAEYVKAVHSQMLNLDTFRTNTIYYLNSGDIRNSFIMHDRILEAIIQRDSDLAGFLMERHYDQFIELVKANKGKDNEG